MEEQRVTIDRIRTDTTDSFDDSESSDGDDIRWAEYETSYMYCILWCQQQCSILTLARFAP